VNRSRGIVTSMFRRLCSRAPRTIRASSAIARESCERDRRETSRYIARHAAHRCDRRAHHRCVRRGARSLYRWQGKVADEREVVIMLKTRSARLESLRSAFGELHPYKVPELLAL